MIPSKENRVSLKFLLLLIIISSYFAIVWAYELFLVVKSLF